MHWWISVALSLGLASCHEKTEDGAPDVDDPYADPGIADHLSDPAAAAWYIDAANGNDDNDGRTPDTAWQHLAKIHSIVLAPGDVVRLARGAVWSGESILFDNGDGGTADQPVIVEPYGTGAAPALRAPRTLWDPDQKTTAVTFGAGSAYIAVLGLSVSGTEEFSGFGMSDDTHHLVIAGNDIQGCGTGIDVRGTDQKILSNTISDSGFDGRGSGVAIGFIGSRLEMAWNTIRNSRVEKDGRMDGGAFEYYGRYFDDDNVERYDLSDDIAIHHNVLDDNLMFIEAYGNATNMVIAHNLYMNSGPSALIFHLDDCEHETWTHECTYQVRLENNTFVTERGSDAGGWGIVGLLVDWDHPADPAKSSVLVRNNIFVTDYRIMAFINPLGDNLVHDHNLFFFEGEGALSDNADGWSLSPTEQIADPLFVDPTASDYRLTGASPAIDAGAGSLYSADLTGVPVPTGDAPDLGACEWVP